MHKLFRRTTQKHTQTCNDNILDKIEIENDSSWKKEQNSQCKR